MSAEKVVTVSRRDLSQTSHSGNRLARSVRIFFLEFETRRQKRPLNCEVVPKPTRTNGKWRRILSNQSEYFEYFDVTVRALALYIYETGVTTYIRLCKTKGMSEEEKYSQIDSRQREIEKSGGEECRVYMCTLVYINI